MSVSIENISDKKLTKEYKVTIPYTMIDEKVDSYIDKVRPTYNLKGFRKGQVPANVIKEKYGKSMLAEESDKFINETIKDLVKDNDLKLALSPKVDVEDFEKVANDNSDIEVKVVFELYPEVPEINLSKLKIVKREAEITQKDVDEALDKLLKFYRKWDKQEDSYKAKKGDSVNIDYVGKIDKEEFEGGSAKGYQLELGSKNFIDNFEDQLVGKKAGDEAKIKVKFPKEYHSAKFAGKAAEFEVKVHEVLTAQAPEINDEFVKTNFGMDNKDKLEEAVKKQVEGNYEEMSKNLFKKELFDFFGKKYDFDLPEGLVEEQLKTIWAEVEEELKTNPEKFKNDKEKKKAKDKKRETAVRMIRSGMILSDLAQKNKVEITSEDINKEMGKIMAKYQGQEQAITEYYQKNPEAIQQLRGSIIEDKTVDFLIGQDSVGSKKTSIKDFDKLWKKANEE